MPVQETNWAGNITFGADRIVCPQTVAELQEQVAAGRQVKVVGARHSFNTIADSADTLISLERFPDTLTIDAPARTATVNGSISYGRLCRLLHQEGFAVHNMASLPHITVAGAIATATHGSGDAHGNLATAVAGLELVTADGQLITRTRDKHADEFPGLVVGLGGVGVVTQVTLDIRPAYAMRQTLFERLPVDQLTAHFDAIMSAAYSVSLFTDWQTDLINQVWLKELAADGEDADLAAELSAESGGEFFGAMPAQTTLHPSGRTSAESCTPQLGATGPWHERLPHFRLEFTPATGNELQSEYFVPRRVAVDAVAAVAALRAILQPILIVSEVRTVAADGLWMSPAYGEDCVGIHFSWHNDWPAVRAQLPVVEAALAPFGARPHWGKLFTVAPAHLHAAYPKLPDFQALLTRYDPHGKFRNPFLRQYIFADSSQS